MNTFRILVFIFSIIVLGLLFSNNLNEIDIAKTKNDAEFYRKPLSEVENSTSLENLKVVAIQQIEYRKKDREIDSKNGIFRNWLIITLFILNVALFLIPQKVNKK